MNESHKHKFEWKKPDTKEYVEDDSIPKTGQIKLCSLVMHSQRVKQNKRQKKKKLLQKSAKWLFWGIRGVGFAFDQQGADRWLLRYWQIFSI